MAPSRVDEPENGDGAGAAPAAAKSSSELKSKWPDAFDLRGSNLPCRLEGEVADLVVLGTVPPEIDGTFYRVGLGSAQKKGARRVRSPAALVIVHR